MILATCFFFFFFFNDTATTEIYTLSLHDALPILFVRGQGEEFDELLSEREFLEHVRAFLVFACRVTFVAQNLPDFGQFLRHERAEQFLADLAAVVEDAVGTADPVPDLRPRDFRRRGILHEIEDRHATGAGEPGTQVLDADIDVDAQALFGDRAFRLEIDQVFCRDVDVVALFGDLIRRFHRFVERFFRDRHQAGVSHPGSVMAIGRFAVLVRAYFGERGVIRGRIVLDRDLRRHAAHGKGAALVAGLDQQQRISAHERTGHGHQSAIGEDEILPGAEFLYATEDVVPAAAIEARRVLPQFEKDFLHFKGRENGFDQDSGLDGALRDVQFILREYENLVPQPRLEVRLHLRKIKINTGLLFHAHFRVVKEIQPEVEQRTRHRLPVYHDVFFVQVPAARAHQQSRRLLGEIVLLALRAGE